jgi:hypothetical protein
VSSCASSTSEPSWFCRASCARRASSAGLARRVQARVALAHLGERVAERAGGVEELAMALDAAERLMLVLAVARNEVRREVAEHASEPSPLFT